MSNSFDSPATANLYFREGSSDKVYQVVLREESGGWFVDFAYGRRGNTLKSGTKNATALTFNQALTSFNKLVDEKKAKGYQSENGAATQFTKTAANAAVSGFLPQLPMALEASRLPEFLRDDGWGMQQKHDGENRMLYVRSSSARGINRKGLFVDIPVTWAEDCKQFSDCLIAGEAVGDSFYAFDLLEFKGRDLRDRTFDSRFAMLKSNFGAAADWFKVVDVAVGATQKKQLLDAIELANGEGGVFKKLDAPFAVGKTKAQYKHKFVESSTCIVLGKNPQRSVAVGLLDDTGRMVNLGNVTIPENFSVPPVDALVEIRYLYRFESGALEQPVFLGPRNDIDREDCLVSQITRIKAKVREEEAAFWWA